MTPRFLLYPLVLLLVATAACLDRKQNGDASLTYDLAPPDGTAIPIVDGPTVDATPADRREAGMAAEAGQTEAGLVRHDLGGTSDSQYADVAPLDGPADAPPVSPDGGADLSPDVLADAPTDLLPPVDIAKDLPPDAPPPDVPGSCPAGQKPCASSGSCIDATACCLPADCPGTCQTCNASHACVAAISQADPNGRCLGTCDSTGACKSKKGQTCQTVAAGCETGTTCSPDGICCDQACTAQCMACDIAGSLGTCAPVASGIPHGSRAACTAGEVACDGTCAGKADGSCSYPTKACTGVSACSGTDKLAMQFACSSGKCEVSSYQTCSGGFACSGSACKTSCSSSADCQAGYYCYNQSCHSKVVSVATGSTHTCAALADGRVVCWGGDYSGGHMLGDGVVHTSPVLNPVLVSGMSTAKTVRAGNSATCALTTAGTVFCWGDGNNGELGTGTNTPASGQTSYWKNSAVQVVTSSGVALTGVTDLYAGAMSFCAKTSSQFYCWGDNGMGSSGYLGFESGTYATSILSATPLPGATTTDSFAMGNLYELAVTGSTTLHAWGDNRGSGLVVSDLTSSSIYPNFSGQNVTLPSSISQVSAGSWQACLLLANGQVQCWGDNFYGALGNGGTIDTAIPGLRTGSGIGFLASHLASGTLFVCAQTTDTSNVMCWGDNSYGVINSNTSNNKIVLPTTVPLGLPIGLTVAEVVTSAVSNHVCVIITDGSLMCWGRGDFMQTGTGQTTTATTPAFVKANW